MRTNTLRRSVVASAASAGILLTGAAPALAGEQSTEEQREQELELTVIEVVKDRVDVAGEVVPTVEILDNGNARVNATLSTGLNIENEAALQRELANAIDNAVTEQLSGGSAQVSVNVNDGDNGNDDGGNDGDGQPSEAELERLVIDVVKQRVDIPGETNPTVNLQDNGNAEVSVEVSLGGNVEDEAALQHELANAIDDAITRRIDGSAQVSVNVIDDENPNEPDGGSDDGGNDNGSDGGQDGRDQVTTLPQGSVAAGGQPDGNVAEHVLGGTALAATAGAGTAAARRFGRQQR